MDNCQKSFSKRKDRQAPQNHFQSERHQIRFQNDKYGKNFFGMTKVNKPFPKRQASKTFEETSAKKF